jgi:hypothetical protein
MSECRNTGLSVPECSCRPCLEAQLAEHQPALLTRPVPDATRPELLASGSVEQPKQPAA